MTCDGLSCPTPEIPPSEVGGPHVQTDGDYYREFHPWCCDDLEGLGCDRDHPHDSGCVFCDPHKIEGPISTVAITARGGREWFLVFEPLNPVSPGHLLVVPVLHSDSAAGNPRSAGQAALVAAQYAANYEAANIITSIGETATQSVMHQHWHVVPRRANDGLPLPWTPQQKEIEVAIRKHGEGEVIPSEDQQKTAAQNAGMTPEAAKELRRENEAADSADQG